MLGCQDFRDFQERNTLFVDKTAQLQAFVEDQKHVFFMRPRRFGQSILVSMLEALFAQAPQLFEHLASAERWHEEQYPVLRLSFLTLDDPATFAQDLCFKLRCACYDAGFHEAFDFLPECQCFDVLASRFEQQVLQGQRYGRTQQVVARWYGVVLLIAEESNQVCAWCPVTSPQGVSHGSPQQPTE